MKKEHEVCSNGLRVEKECVIEIMGKGRKKAIVHLFGWHLHLKEDYQRL